MVPRHERDTLPPAFDLAQYARDSESSMAASPPTDEVEEQPTGRRKEPASDVRVAVRAKVRVVATDEVWAKKLSGRPRVTVTADQLRELPLDHKAGFVLSLMDGSIDLDTLVLVAGLPRGEVIRIVRSLCDSGVVKFA